MAFGLRKKLYIEILVKPVLISCFKASYASGDHMKSGSRVSIPQVLFGPSKSQISALKYTYV